MQGVGEAGLQIFVDSEVRSSGERIHETKNFNHAYQPEHIPDPTGIFG